MAGHSFTFQKGALSLEDDALIQSFTKKKRVPKFTAIVHGFMSCTAMLGIVFSALAYFISDQRNTIARRPQESLRVAISLLVPILWPGLHVLLFENFSEGSLGLLCTGQDVVMIIVLIYFPAVSTTTVSDNGPEGICDTVMIAGLVCAYLVA
jgi:Fe2+ transport system protein B